MTQRQIVFGTLPQAQKDNVLIVFDNRLIQRKNTSVSADSEAPEGNMNAVNLLSENRSDFWRSDSVLTASQQPTPEISITYAMSSPRAVDWLSYHWSNIHVPWRADLYRGDPAASGVLLHTTGWMHPIVKSEGTDFLYDTFPWRLGPTTEWIQQMAVEMRLQSFAHLSERVYGVDHVVWRFDVTDGQNGGRDFLQASLFFAGVAFQPHVNMSLGVTLVPVDRSVKRRTAGGAATGITRPTDSELVFVLDHLTDDEGMSQLFTDWVRREGALARVFVYKEPSAEKRIHFYDGGAFVGTLESFDALAIDEQPGEIADIFATKNVKGIKIQGTE